MSSSDPAACRCTPCGESQQERLRCCCETRCTCRHCHGPPVQQRHSSRSHSRHSKHNHQSSRCHAEEGEEKAAARDGGPQPGRRCTSCLPEQVELGEADLLVRQQRCGEARVAERQRRASLAISLHYRGGDACCPAYTSNTAELLRLKSGVAHQAAVEAEYVARRRTLQAELAMRRSEIAALRKSREEQQVEAALCVRESVVPRCCHVGLRRCHSGGGCRRHRRHSPLPRRRVSPPCPPPPPQPQKQSKVPPAADMAPRVEVSQERPPARHHRQHHHRSPCGCRAPSPLQRSQLPAPPPPCCERVAVPACRCGTAPACSHVHHSPPPAPQSRQPQVRVCPPHASLDPAVGAAAAVAAAGCPSCGSALLTARDIVSLVAAGQLESSVACPACAFVGGRLTTSVAHRGASPREPASADDAAEKEKGQGRGRASSSSAAGPRSSSAGPSSSSPASSPPASSGWFTVPRFGRKVYITDDMYRDRRARYLAEWEARGAVRRMPQSSRSPSAPLPERTPKWRTTGSGIYSE